MELRVMTPEDRSEVAELIYGSLNTWYKYHGGSEIFTGSPKITEVFYEVYNDLTPGCTVVAVNPENGRLMGSCFYHPREHHVSLGIMNVHPNYFGRGIGGAMLKHIIDYTEKNGYKALRLTQSAMNLDSFSLYNRYGFVPRISYQDMCVKVPDKGFNGQAPKSDSVRDASLEDVSAISELEKEISGICREIDYRYCIENKRGYWHTSVVENSSGGIDGFMVSCGHEAFNMLGPCFAKTEEDVFAMIMRELNQYKGRSPVVLIPTQSEKLVRKMYDLGARNCEMHFTQVRGEFQPFKGISLPTFLPETG